MAAEAQLKAIIDNSPATICLKDAEGRYQLVNKHFSELYGMAADGMLGKTVHELFPKESADPSGALDQRVLRTGIPEEREQVVTTPDGPRIFNEIKFPIVVNDENGMVNAIGLIATEVTERKQTEVELQRLARAVEATHDAVVITDLGGDIQFVNSAFEELTRYSRQEALGQNPRILKSGKQPDEVYAAMWQAITGRKPVKQALDELAAEIDGLTAAGRPIR